MQRLHLLEAAQRIHLRLGVARVGIQFLAQLGGELRPVGRAHQVLRRDQFVQQLRLPRDHLSSPWACRQQAYQLAQCRRIFGQQREIRGAPGNGLDERGEALQRDRRVGLAADDFERWRQQGVEPELRRFGQPCGVLAQGVERRQYARRVVVAGILQQRLGGVGVCGAAAHGGQRMAVLVGLRRSEYLLEMARDFIPMAVERCQHGRVVGEAHCLGEHGLRFGVVRQELGLRVVQVLDAVLQPAQEIVGGSEFLLRVGSHEAGLHQCVQHDQCWLLLQCGNLAATDELEHLRGEFDFADAARPQLDVVRHLATCDLAADLHVQVADRGEGAEIEVFAEHEGPHDLHQFVVSAAGERARLDPGITLPRPPLRHQVVFQHRVAHRERAGFAPRAQPQVDTENIAVGGVLPQRGGELAPQADEEFVVGKRADRGGRIVGRGVAFLRVEIDEIDVGRHVELKAAELAHADHDHLLWNSVFVARLAVARGQFGVMEIECGGNAHLGQRAVGGHHLGEIGLVRQIARGDDQPYPLAQLP